MNKRHRSTLTIATTAFQVLAHTQAKALGQPDLPVAIIPHPLGPRSRKELQDIVDQQLESMVKLVCERDEASRTPQQDRQRPDNSALVEVEDDVETINRLCQERRWGDGLPIIPPTRERVERMLRGTTHAPEDVIAHVPPGFGAATVRLIAVNAVMAGCAPDGMPVLIAAVEAVCDPVFNLQGIQATTNAATAFLIVNGPIASRLQMNGGLNCLGQGNWANASIGRALHLVMQNVGRALPGEMDRATQGQPGKFTFCCAENEADSPWTPLHVDRGFRPEQSTVTVVGASGTLNMLCHEKDAADLLRVMADSITYPTSNDYWCGGAPWVVLGPEHAEILAKAGLDKSAVQLRLWELSKMKASRRSIRDLARTRDARAAELGEIGPDTLLPISPTPQDLGIIVAGGPGTHSVYIPTFGNTRSVTREVRT